MIDTIESAQKLAAQNDRILFIIVILLLGSGMLYGIRMVAKYFITQHQLLVEEFREERRNNAASIKEINDSRINTLKQFNLEREKEHGEFVRCVDASTAAIEENTKVLAVVSQTIEHCRRVNQ